MTETKTSETLDIREIIRQVAPSTLAGKLRDAMPDIEARLAAGVRLTDIHAALTSAGFAVTLSTLKTYLYRYRKSTAPSVHDITPQVVVSTSSQKPAAKNPPSIPELGRLMKPDPARDANDMARYERLAKQKSREGNPT